MTVTKVTHIIPCGGQTGIVEAEADTDSEWQHHIEECDVCSGPNRCIQTTIQSQNHRTPIVIHGLTSAPMLLVPLPVAQMVIESKQRIEHWCQVCGGAVDPAPHPAYCAACKQTLGAMS